MTDPTEQEWKSLDAEMDRRIAKMLANGHTPLDDDETDARLEALCRDLSAETDQ